MVGFSKLAGSDEERTLARLRALRSDLIDPTIAVHNGRIVKRTGDGVLIEFRSVVDAVRCAIEMQNGMIERNARAGTLTHLLLHRLRQALRTLAQCLERAPLRIDRAVGVAFAEAALGLAHGVAGTAEVVDVALALALALLARLTLLVRAETAVLELFEQLVQPVAQRLLALPQVAERVALLALLPLLALLSLLALLPLPALLPTLAAAPALVLTLTEGAVAQFLLVVDHVAELVELLHHLAEVVAVHVRRRHLQVFHHLLELLQQLTRGVLSAVARHVFQAVEQTLEVLRAQHARIAVERTRELLIVLELLLHRLHYGPSAQLVHHS